MSLKWNSVIGKTYRVASKSALTTKTWTDLSGTITATTTNTSGPTPPPAQLLSAFYTVLHDALTAGMGFREILNRSQAHPRGDCLAAGVRRSGPS